MDAKSPAKGVAMFPKVVYTPRASQSVPENSPLSRLPPGDIIPCVRTTIEGHSRAVHELFDADDGDIIPCLRIESEMLKGGVLGAVEMTIDDDLSSFKLTIEGGKTYRLVGGELVPEGAAPT